MNTENTVISSAKCEMVLAVAALADAINYSDRPNVPLSVLRLTPALLKAAADAKCIGLKKACADVLTEWYRHGIEHGSAAMHADLLPPMRMLQRSYCWLCAEERDAERAALREAEALEAAA